MHKWESKKKFLTMKEQGDNSFMRCLFTLLKKCGTEDGVMPPTLLYNEGWMLRLVLDWFSRQTLKKHPLRFLEDACWYSEVLLHTQFQARFRGDPLTESHTNADGAIGSFEVGGTGKYDLTLLPDARQLIIVEAKMFSGLSKGTQNEPNFDQAARSVACIAEALSRANRRPELLESLGFAVVAPASQIELNLFQSKLDKSSIKQRVSDRVRSYNGIKDSWFENWFIPTLNRIEINELSWESCVDFITARTPREGSEFYNFLMKCLYFNGT